MIYGLTVRPTHGLTVRVTNTFMTKIKLYYSKWKGLKLILLSSFFVLPAIWMLLKGEEPLWLWISSVLFFGLGYVVGAYLLFDRRAQIIIDEQGIFDRSILNEPIPWSVIQNAYLFGVSNQKFIALVLASSFKPQIKLGWRQRITGRLNKSAGFNRYNINIAHIAVQAEVLEDFLKALIHTDIKDKTALMIEFNKQLARK